MTFYNITYISHHVNNSNINYIMNNFVPNMMYKTSYISRELNNSSYQLK